MEQQDWAKPDEILFKTLTRIINISRTSQKEKKRKSYTSTFKSWCYFLRSFFSFLYFWYIKPGKYADWNNVLDFWWYSYKFYD